MAYFKITNRGDLPIAIPWNRTLLSAEDKEAYDYYKTTPDYLGIDASQQAAYNKKGEAERMQPFFQALAKGIQIKAYDPNNRGYGLGVPTPVYHYVIGGDWEKLKLRPLSKLARQNNITSIQDLCNTYYIPFTPRDTKEALIEKLKTKIGSNVIIVDDEALENFISTGHVRKQIIQKLKPGQSTAEIVTEGNIEVEEVDNPEQSTDEEISATGESREELEKLSYQELKDRAKSRGLQYVGVKAEKLIESLING